MILFHLIELQVFQTENGESSFTLTLKKSIKGKQLFYVAPRFNIELYIRDFYLLEKIQNYFQVGKVRINKFGNKAVNSVGSIKDINNIIIPHFIKYPLITEKQKDFELFPFGSWFN